MTAPSPTGGRVGASYFVPGVRVFKLAATLAEGPETGEPLADDVAAEILRVEVTRVNSGSCQYSITFNNWFTSTATDRRGPQAVGAGEVAGRDRPLWPRFKYNSFDLVKFGDRLRIDLRYWPEASADDGGGPVDAREWVPMISGPITDMRFVFGAEGSTVVITGEDDLSTLKDRHNERHEFGQVAEGQLTQRVLDLARYPLPIAHTSSLSLPSFATGSQAPAEALGEDQSYLDYLQKIADKLDCEVFIEYADLTDPESGVTFHFEPARCALPPDDANADLFRLARDRNLISFQPTIKVLDMPTSVQVSGRHLDPRRAERVMEQATADELRHELFPAAGPNAPIAAPSVRQHFFPGRENRLNLPNTTNLDNERGRFLARTKLCQKAREFMVIEATTIGLPRLRPGAHVEITGMRPPFDGFYYLTRTIHSIGPDGYRTKLTARRPGMPLPPSQEP